MSRVLRNAGFALPMPIHALSVQGEASLDNPLQQPVRAALYEFSIPGTTLSLGLFDSFHCASISLFRRSTFHSLFNREMQSEGRTYFPLFDSFISRSASQLDQVLQDTNFALSTLNHALSVRAQASLVYLFPA